MTKRTNRGRLPNPDRRGYARPEVGGKRFIVGNIKDVGTAEMERRLADLRNLFERQCQYHEIDHWAGSVLPHAKKLAAGERLVLRVSDYARNSDGQASEEAQHLHELRELGLDIVPDDPCVITRGEKELKQLVDSTVEKHSPMQWQLRMHALNHSLLTWWDNFEQQSPLTQARSRQERFLMRSTDIASTNSRPESGKTMEILHRQFRTTWISLCDSRRT
jgi:hypothetical protein